MTMPYTTDDLVTELRERAEHAPLNPARAGQAAHRGRRLLRRRRARRAASAVACAGAVAALAATVPGAAPPAAAPVSVRLPADVPLPGSARVVSPDRLPLRASAHRTLMGERADVRFTALSTDTVVNVRCAVPDAWLYVRYDNPGEARSLGRCGSGDNLAQFDHQSAGTGWTGTVRTVEVWVLPPDAPVSTGGPWDVPAIADRAGTEPGAWAVGVYDRRR